MFLLRSSKGLIRRFAFFQMFTLNPNGLLITWSHLLLRFFGMITLELTLWYHPLCRVWNLWLIKIFGVNDSRTLTLISLLALLRCRCCGSNHFIKSIQSHSWCSRLSRNHLLRFLRYELVAIIAVCGSIEWVGTVLKTILLRSYP